MNTRGHVAFGVDAKVGSAGLAAEAAQAEGATAEAQAGDIGLGKERCVADIVEGVVAQDRKNRFFHVVSVKAEMPSLGRGAARHEGRADHRDLPGVEPVHRVTKRSKVLLRDRDQNEIGNLVLVADLEEARDAFSVARAAFLLDVRFDGIQGEAHGEPAAGRLVQFLDLRRIEAVTAGIHERVQAIAGIVRDEVEMVRSLQDLAAGKRNRPVGADQLQLVEN